MRTWMEKLKKLAIKAAQFIVGVCVPVASGVGTYIGIYTFAVGAGATPVVAGILGLFFGLWVFRMVYKMVHGIILYILDM